MCLWFVQRWLAMSRCSGSADLGTSLPWIKASSCLENHLREMTSLINELHADPAEI